MDCGHKDGVLGYRESVGKQDQNYGSFTTLYIADCELFSGVCCRHTARAYPASTATKKVFRLHVQSSV